MADPPAAGRTTATTLHAPQLEQLIASVRDYAIFLLDRHGNIASWNAGAERIKGYAAEEIVGRHFSAFYTEEDVERDHPAHELEIAAREGRYEEEGWRIRKDGSRFWASVTITAVRDADGVLAGFGKVTRDLTVRRLAEERLQLTAAELRAANRELDQFGRLVASVRDYAIFMLDRGGHVTTWNAGAEHINGYVAEEIVGRHFSIFYTDEDRARDHPADELEIATREGRYEEEGWRVRKDGTRFWSAVTITAIRDADGGLDGFAKITRDLTARRAAEEALRRAQAELERSNAELQRFAAVAAHDLRAPLATVAGFVELLRRQEADRLSQDGRALMTTVTDSVLRMQDLIEDLLTYARLEREEVELRAVNVGDSLRRVLGDLDAQIAEHGAVVRAGVPPDADVLADRSGVDILLANLVSNAIKFGDAAQPEVDVSAARTEHGWRVTVADNGPGVDDDDRARIFAAFERLPEAAGVPGSGLGLSICRRVVDRSGGELGVDTTADGGGSRFWFSLPAAG